MADPGGCKRSQVVRTARKSLALSVILGSAMGPAQALPDGRELAGGSRAEPPPRQTTTSPSQIIHVGEPARTRAPAIRIVKGGQEIAPPEAPAFKRRKPPSRLQEVRSGRAPSIMGGAAPDRKN